MSGVLRTVRAVTYLVGARGSLSIYYRGDLLLRAVGAVLELFIAYVFFDLIYRAGALTGLAPWPRVLWLLAIAHVVEGVFRTLFSGLNSLTAEIRRGTLDVILLWPVDSLAWISFRRANPVSVLQLLAALPLIVRTASLTRLTAAHALAAGALLLLGLGIRIHLSMLAALLSLYLVRADAVTFVVEELSAVSRYPIAAFRGAGRLILSYILPVLLVANLPALALTGGAPPAALVGWAVGFNVGAHILCRAMWRRGISRYASAGG